MKKVLIVLPIIAVAAVATAGFLLARNRSAASASYRFVAVDRGDITSTVSATGTLSAVRTVAVGTQVSGQIAELGADFNDHVRRGQVVARLDSTILVQAIAQAQTDLDKARAAVVQTRFLSDQADSLKVSGSVSDTDLRTAGFNYAVAQSALASSQIALQRARQNLTYATIRSPIDGIVIERDVDVGQTVAASLSAPQLFLIAQDLRRMQILASVDESDIGQIAVGQPARFTVQAFPNRTFVGTVGQVRLQSTTTSNVVSYTVVVAVDNADGALLPGMTATVNFQVAKATAVLRVANAALRFRPSTEMAAAIQAARRASGDTSTAGARPDSATRAAWRASPASGGTAGAAGAAASGGGPALSGATRGGTAAAGGLARRPAATSLYYLDAAGKPQVARVRTGLTDGQFTEVSGPALREGMQVIAGLNTAGSAAAATSGASTNPFQQNQPRQGAGGPRPGGM